MSKVNKLIIKRKWIPIPLTFTQFIESQTFGRNHKVKIPMKKK